MGGSSNDEEYDQLLTTMVLKFSGLMKIHRPLNLVKLLGLRKPIRSSRWWHVGLYWSCCLVGCLCGQIKFGYLFDSGIVKNIYHHMKAQPFSLTNSDFHRCKLKSLVCAR